MCERFELTIQQLTFMISQKIKNTKTIHFTLETMENIQHFYLTFADCSINQLIFSCLRCNLIKMAYNKTESKPES